MDFHKNLLENPNRQCPSEEKVLPKLGLETLNSTATHRPYYYGVKIHSSQEEIVTNHAELLDSPIRQSS